MTEIRPFVAADIPAIQALLEQLQAVELSHQPDRKSPPTVAAHDIWRETEGLLAKGSADVLVAVAGAALIGVCIGYENQSGDQSLTQEARRSGYISDLVVDTAWRGKGVGRSLLEAMFDRFRARGLKVSRIGAISENLGAIRLYQEMGFKPVSIALEKPL